MTRQARQRLQRLAWIMLFAIGLVTLGYSLSKQYWIYYQAPSDSIRRGKVRVGGLVQRIQPIELGITFDVCDENGCLVVLYQGEIPQMFAENKEALIEGVFEGTLLRGSRILAKHDERYERKKKPSKE